MADFLEVCKRWYIWFRETVDLSSFTGFLLVLFLLIFIYSSLFSPLYTVYISFISLFCSSRQGLYLTYIFTIPEVDLEWWWWWWVSCYLFATMILKSFLVQLMKLPFETLDITSLELLIAKTAFLVVSSRNITRTSSRRHFCPWGCITWPMLVSGWSYT